MKKHVNQQTTISIPFLTRHSELRNENNCKHLPHDWFILDTCQNQITRLVQHLQIGPIQKRYIQKSRLRRSEIRRNQRHKSVNVIHTNILCHQRHEIDEWIKRKNIVYFGSSRFFSYTHYCINSMQPNYQNSNLLMDNT